MFPSTRFYPNKVILNEMHYGNSKIQLNFMNIDSNELKGKNEISNSLRAFFS